MTTFPRCTPPIDRAPGTPCRCHLGPVKTYLLRFQYDPEIILFHFQILWVLLTGENYKSAQSQRKSKCKVLGRNKTKMEVLSVDPIRGVDSWPQFSRWERLQRNISAQFPFIHKSRFLDTPLLNQGLLTYISKNMFSLRPPPAAGPLWHHNHFTQGN